MIYFDNAATTKPSATALSKAAEFNNENFFNPSALYRGGLYCNNALKTARSSVLRNLGLSETKYEVVFTSCGSESDNNAIFGAVKRGVFVTDKGEHSAVIKCFIEQKNRNNTVFFCGLNKDGSVNEKELLSLITDNRVDFVSIMHVNNETGAINDINTLANKIKSQGTSLALIQTKNAVNFDFKIHCVCFYLFCFASSAAFSAAAFFSARRAALLLRDL